MEEVKESRKAGNPHRDEEGPLGVDEKVSFTKWVTLARRLSLSSASSCSMTCSSFFA